MFNKFRFGIILAVLVMFAGVSANAAVFTVDNTSDDGNLSACTNAANDCSLRGAFNQANASPTNDTINFDPAIFSTPQTIVLGGTQLSVSNSGALTIQGPGANLLAISGNTNSRILEIINPVSVSLSGLTLTQGNGIGNASIFGGAIRVFSGGASLNLDSVSVSGNYSAGGGGGIQLSFASSVNIKNSTFSGNNASLGGGAMQFESAGVVNITNTTISGNSATSSVSAGGGGIRATNSNVVINITNSTITNNTTGFDGGGIAQESQTNTIPIVNIRNTIVAGNIESSGGNAPDISGNITSQGYNLIGDGSGGTITAMSGDQIGTNTSPINALLAPLGDNGGTTLTHALLAGSPAINAGSNALAVDQNNQPLANDQRGTGFPRISDNTVDIGAFENQVPSNTAPTISANAVSVSADSSSNRTVAFVSDNEDNNGDLTVSIVGANSSNGVTISNLAVDSLGNVTANISATCGASSASFGLQVTDSGSLTGTTTLNVSVTPETVAPVINQPNDVVVYLPMNSTATSMVVTFANPTATDNCDADPTVTASPSSGTVFNVGETTVTVNAVDAAGNNAAPVTFKVRVLYNFNGFFSPIENNVLNNAKAGSAIPVKFSLSGNKGLGILAAGYPVSYQIPCSGTGSNGDEIPTDTSGNSGLNYEAGSDQYKYVWKTEKSWKDTCRRLVVKLNDGSIHTADFQFK